MAGWFFFNCFFLFGVFGGFGEGGLEQLYLLHDSYERRILEKENTLYFSLQRFN